MRPLALSSLTQYSTPGIMQLNTILVTNGWEIHNSPPDGHCLLHSFISSCSNQLPSLTGLSLESIIMSIKNEVNNNIPEYTSFGLSAASLAQQLNAYLLYRDYDSPSMMVPLVLARAYSINISI